MNQRSTLALAACACLAVLGWIVLGPSGRPTAPPLSEPDDGAVTRAEDRPEADLAGLDARPTDTPVERRAAASDAAPRLEAGEHPWADQLAGLTGRVLEADGRPAADLRVELLQVDANLMLAAEATALGNPSLELAETRTDAEGRFVLDGAYVGAFHLLGLDRGGPRSTLRFVESALVLGERVDLGDILLDAFATLTGTVIDEDGEPVAGARVRVAPVPDIVIETGVLDLRADSLIAFGQSADSEFRAISIPKLIGDQLASLPFPTTYTATDGTFRLEGVPLKRVVGGVDHPGYVAAPIPGRDIKPGEHDLGELELVRGRTLTGRVVDAAGAPVAGAEVYGGVLQSLAPVGILQPAGLTDASGAFSLTGVPEVGSLVGFARRAPSDSWVSATAAGGAERLEFSLPTAARLTVRVLDRAGDPVRGARLKLEPRVEDPGFGELSRITTFANARTPRPALAVSEVEPGQYAVEAVSYGEWLVEAEADGFAPARQRVRHESTSTLVTLTCGPGERLTVRVLDAVTGAPVAKAHASLLAPTTMMFGALDAAWTDAAGVAELGPFMPVAEAVALGAENGMPSEVLLRVVHPGYADHTATALVGGATLDVRLTAACMVTGRVHWGGAVPDRRYMLMLAREGVQGLAEVFAMPRVGLSDAEGKFRFTSLPAGKYELHVAERYLTGSPLDLVLAQQEPVLRHRVEVEVLAGAPTVVDVDLTPTGKGPTARVAGTVRANGAPVQGAVVKGQGPESFELTTNSNGEFESAELSAIRGVYVTIEGEVDLPDGSRQKRSLYQEWQQLEPGAVNRIDVDVELRAVTIEVVDRATGVPVAGASVSVMNGGDSVTTGADGRASVISDLKAGTMFQVNADGYAQTGTHIRNDTPGVSEVVRVELVRPVPCSGRVRMDELADESQSWSYIHVQEVDGSASDGVGLDRDPATPGERTFTLSNLPPGRYRAQIYRNGEQSEPIEFELGPEGATDLLFEHRPMRNGGD